MKIVKRDDNNRPYYPVRSIFDDFFAPVLWDELPLSQQGVASLSADVWEDKDNIFVKMALPGVKKDDIKITIHQDNISISGHTKQTDEKEEKGKKYYLHTMESSFEQSFNLPTKINPDAAEAQFVDGVLQVKLPKAEEVKPKEIAIK